MCLSVGGHGSWSRDCLSTNQNVNLSWELLVPGSQINIYHGVWGMAGWVLVMFRLSPACVNCAGALDEGVPNVTWRF